MDSWAVELAQDPSLSDEEVIQRVLEGDHAQYEILMRRYNTRLYRAARAILGSDSDAEDVMQEAYVRAFQHLKEFEGRARFSTWLTRIAVNEALARRRKRERYTQDHPLEFLGATGSDPERIAFDRELHMMIESAIDELPEHYRAVFVLREIEEMSTQETAESLEISEEAVKTRLHRARAQLHQKLLERAGLAASNAFAFPRQRCDRVVAAVLNRIPARS